MAPPPPLELKNVQGDILVGFPKNTETYFFFQIDRNHVGQFRKQLSQLVPLITTAAKASDDKKTIKQNKPEKTKVSNINVVFSKKGLRLLGFDDPTGDPAFEAGMLLDAANLGDQGTKRPDGTFDPNWLAAFKQDIHGLVLVAGDSRDSVRESLTQIEQIFHIGHNNASIKEVLRLVGDVRPGVERGHEHFGFLDGVSQPAVAGVDNKPHPGQDTVKQGIILVGREGDQIPNRPAWALDGSFLAFRYLPQLVPEFNKFLDDNPIPALVDRKKGSEFLGARLVGRWKSGAPIDIAFDKDDPDLGRDETRNDNFRYNFPGDQENQDRCPFGAHTRKTNPRADLDTFGGTEERRILRRGIQFGPELTDEEKSSHKTTKDRGLLFACYQSNIPNGFQFIQHSWANNIDFPPPPKPPAGFDPLIGQAGPGKPRSLIGTNPKSQSTSLDLTAEWVLSKGGEYFFSPSIPTLKNKFAIAAAKEEL